MSKYYIKWGHENLSISETHTYYIYKRALWGFAPWWDEQVSFVVAKDQLEAIKLAKDWETQMILDEISRSYKYDV